MVSWREYLQSVTVCPFRVVDEINQGMDVINERKVFVLLSAAAGRQVLPNAQQSSADAAELTPVITPTSECQSVCRGHGPSYTAMLLHSLPATCSTPARSAQLHLLLPATQSAAAAAARVPFIHFVGALEAETGWCRERPSASS